MLKFLLKMSSVTNLRITLQKGELFENGLQFSLFISSILPGFRMNVSPRICSRIWQFFEILHKRRYLHYPCPRKGLAKVYRSHFMYKGPGDLTLGCSWHRPLFFFPANACIKRSNLRRRLGDNLSSFLTRKFVCTCCIQNNFPILTFSSITLKTYIWIMIDSCIPRRIFPKLPSMYFMPF